MTRGEIERLKAIWEICFIAWILFWVAMACSITNTQDMLAASIFWLIAEVVLLFAGYWIAAQRPK